MGTYMLTTEDGRKFKVTADNPQQAYDALQQMLGGASATQSEPSGASALTGVAPLRKEGQTFGQALRENIVGEGEVDTFGEQVGDIIGTGAAGILRGIKGIAETPEMLVRLGKRAGEEISEYTGTRDPSEEKTAVLDTATGRAIGGAYRGLAGAVGADPEGLARRGETTAAQYAGTIGEFLPAAIGGGAGATKAMITAGVGSETAGQLTEGTQYEPIARVIGAFGAPMATSALRGIKNKTVEFTQRRAIEQPAVETARQAKDASYKAFEAAGGKVAVKMDDVIRDIERSIDADDMFIAYEPQMGGTAQYIDEARRAIIKHAGKDFNLAKLDKLRAALGQTYKASGFDPRVGFIRDKLDDIIQNAPVTEAGKAGDLLKTARSDFRRYKKIEVFDELMDKAERGAAKTGSGGNVVNKYLQAVDSILNSPSKRRQFDANEIEMMENFVRGDLGRDAMRLIGKLSPSGNGLMAALNVAAIATNPAFVAGTVAGVAAKARGESMALGNVDQIRKALISGVAPNSKKGFERELRVFLGLQANEGQ